AAACTPSRLLQGRSRATRTCEPAQRTCARRSVLASIRAMIRLVAVVISAGLLAAGCGSEEAETPAAPAWDPCTVSDQLIIDAGFAAPSNRKDVAAGGDDAWAGCGWSSADAAVRIQFADDTDLAQLR